MTIPKKSMEQKRREWWQARCDSWESYFDRQLREIQNGIDELRRQIDMADWLKDRFDEEYERMQWQLENVPGCRMIHGRLHNPVTWQQLIEKTEAEDRDLEILF